MIGPSPPLGMLLSWISLAATVSPVGQLSAPTFAVNLFLFVVWGKALTVYQTERAFAKGIPKLLEGAPVRCQRRILGSRRPGTDIVIE